MGEVKKNRDDTRGLSDGESARLAITRPDDLEEWKMVTGGRTSQARAKVEETLAKRVPENESPKKVVDPEDLDKKKKKGQR